MCFHASQTKSVSALEAQYNVVRSQTFEIEDHDFMDYHLNGFSHPEMLIIPQESQRELHPSIWGLIPEYIPGHKQNEYYKQSARYGGGLNARAEKAFTSNQYKEAIVNRRCIIPVSGFFEPHTFQGKKYPYYFKAKNNNALSIAGIYNRSNGIVSFSMLTKNASPLFAKIHNSKERQVVLLDKELEREWLRDDLNQKHIQELIDVNYDDQSLETYTVSKALFSIKQESNYEGITDRVVYNELNP